ncbi:hypothetical protein B0T24DRAFT_533304 [Lasiosphaeria ovina]|uniref:Uncharacterized protein n=1 Tax=Lasiosphaeria ovina TaxID=92902 RepID=A0AAE0N4A0_9PEZI|nr:hypothetical protein B0T24DRAFT_533304 [Lasiosphaeria ovina]
MQHHRQFLCRCIIATALPINHVLVHAKPESAFLTCSVRLNGILNGTLTHNGIDKETVQQYIYHGPIGRMKQSHREESIAITTEGCKAICDDPIDWYWASDPTFMLGIISTWVLPVISLLAALPYDAGTGGWHKNVKRTVLALFNWLGSPQTALTATFFNIHQMRECLRAAGVSDDREIWGLKTDAYYVLCCTGQFELPTDKDCFLEALTYGLFKPIHDLAKIPAKHNNTAKRWTADLLRVMARQMRRSRRLGVWATSASIFLFFVAYAVSVVLAFLTTTHSIAFGTLISWFPLLLFFSILDRNPNSAERTRKLIYRWMWNVRAIKKWEEDQDTNRTAINRETPYWWSPSRELTATSSTKTTPKANLPDGSHHKCTRSDRCVPTLFIGQGRRVGYHGLAHSVIASVSSSRPNDPEQLAETIAQTKTDLLSKPPGAWIWCSLGALVLVWWEISMALVISYNIPTVGIGCRSGLFIIFGILSTVPWFAHMFDCLGPRGKAGRFFSRVLNWVSNVFLAFSVPCLAFITFAAFSGVLKNCTCSGGFSRYVDFTPPELYRNPEYFDVMVWMVAAVVTAAFPVALSFFVALPVLVSLRALWKDLEPIASADGENGATLQDVGGKVDMDWVAH